ncbi:MAG: hypothetical protein ACP5I4_03275 [Oceanipulchritudo sp.]
MVGLCAFAAWLAGPLVWSNLFHVHDYYYYSTTVFGFMWITMAAAGLSERWKAMRIPMQSALAVLALSMALTYPFRSYYKAQVNDWGRDKADFAAELAGEVPEDGAFLVIGEDWNPILAYYSERYALMLRWPNEERGPRFAEALERMQAENRQFAGAVVRMDSPMAEQAPEVLMRFGFSKEPLLISRSGNLRYYPAE